MVSWNELIISNFEKVDFYNKGVLLATCAHLLIFFLVIGILKVKITEAGRVPKEWIYEIN